MDLLKCHGKSFTCQIYGEPRSGKITVRNDIAYLCQNNNDGEHAVNKWGYYYAWCVQDGSARSLERNSVTNLVVEDYEKPDKLVIDMRAIALEHAKKAFGNDTDNIDAFINGWELGIEWFKQQNNIK